jgi:hypothetical protein
VELLVKDKRAHIFFGAVTSCRGHTAHHTYVPQTTSKLTWREYSLITILIYIHVQQQQHCFTVTCINITLGLEWKQRGN